MDIACLSQLFPYISLASINPRTRSVRPQRRVVASIFTRKNFQCHHSENAETLDLERRNDLETFAMSNVTPKRTGLPMVIYISVKYASHGCRLKVSQIYGNKTRFGKWFSMTVEDEPRIIGDTGDIKLKDIQLVTDFCRLNMRTILDFWDQDDCIDSGEMMDTLVKLE